MLLRISGSGDQQAATAAMGYVSPDSGAFYLSKKVLRDLKIVPESFPSIGSSVAVGVQVEHSPTVEPPDQGRSSGETKCTEGECLCPKRTLPS